MNTIEKILLGSFILASAWVVEDYLTTNCMSTDLYIEQMPSGQYNHTEIKSGKCYLIE